VPGRPDEARAVAEEKLRSDSQILVDKTELARLVLRALRGAGASEGSAEAAVRAMMHASLVGVDSHGVRLVEHYCLMLGGGRLKKDPQLGIKRTAAASAMVDADDGLGHYAAYGAVEVGVEIARETGFARSASPIPRISAQRGPMQWPGRSKGA
jgi:ureidoglycolate dehydrogenase (NAD+)